MLSLGHCAVSLLSSASPFTVPPNKACFDVTVHWLIPEIVFCERMLFLLWLLTERQLGQPGKPLGLIFFSARSNSLLQPEPMAPWKKKSLNWQGLTPTPGKWSGLQGLIQTLSVLDIPSYPQGGRGRERESGKFPSWGCLPLFALLHVSHPSNPHQQKEKKNYENPEMAKREKLLR